MRQSAERSESSDKNERRKKNPYECSVWCPHKMRQISPMEWQLMIVSTVNGIKWIIRTLSIRSHTHTLARSRSQIAQKSSLYNNHCTYPHRFKWLMQIYVSLASFFCESEANPKYNSNSSSWSNKAAEKNIRHTHTRPKKAQKRKFAISFGSNGVWHDAEVKRKKSI